MGREMKGENEVERGGECKGREGKERKGGKGKGREERRSRRERKEEFISQCSLAVDATANSYRFPSLWVCFAICPYAVVSQCLRTLCGNFA